MKTLDMSFIRYLNLFEKITSVRCKNCFLYNSVLIFAVPQGAVSRAVGINGNNVKRLSEILGKRIKILPLPRDMRDIFKFVAMIVQPIEIKKIEINGEEAVITSDNGNKAALIGRKKARLEEKAVVDAKKGEAIFTHYTELKQVLGILREAKGKMNEKELMYKMQKFAFVKSFDLKKSRLVVEMD